MKSIEELLENMGFARCQSCKKYSPAGTTYMINSENYKGIYWYYETSEFIIDIHNFFIIRDFIMTSSPDISEYMSLISTYIITANGEWVNPYQNMTSNSMFVMDANKKDLRFLLHGNYPFFSVGINFKKKMIENWLIEKLNINKHEATKIFLETSTEITKPISKLAHEILHCTMDSTSAELFFEAKAKEWLSITLNEYMNKSKEDPLAEIDKNAIENVAAYINDHYAFDIPQEFFENISLMSGTKLKTAFKQRYKMSITEYTQRKRMNIAENLLLTTSLEIKDIAKSVGYNSPSRFTTLFKRYKGIYPKEVKAFGDRMSPIICDCKKSTYKK